MKTPLPAHHSAKIKDLWLEVSSCDFYHSHLGEKETFFLGRKKAKEHLKMLLRHSKSRSGAYLVTGYRGMGKTSLVHTALEELKKDKEVRPFEKIPISLSQDDIRDMDVLRLIARQLASKWKERELQKSRWKWAPAWALLLAAFFFVLGIINGGAIKVEWSTHFFTEHHSINFEFYALIIGTIILLLVGLNVLYHGLYGSIIGHKNYRGIQARLEFLNARLDALVSKEKGFSVSPEAKSGWGTKFSLFSASSKTAQSYKIATPKEIEKELIGIFNDIESYRNWPIDWGEVRWYRQPSIWLGRFFRAIHRVPEYVFILDELDKIEPDFVTAPSPANENQHSATVAQNTQRRETIARLLSSLKSFLNEAKAKFIFIGGREMFDASLADTADRETFYGSIFHSVIYLNSFFKDKIQHRSGVSRITEAYLCHLLIPEWYLQAFVDHHPDKKKVLKTDWEEWYNLETLYHYLVDCQRTTTLEFGTHQHDFWNAKFSQNERSEAAHKIIYLLQNFIIFLTYRSSGTPKKLAGLLENYIVSGDTGRVPGDGHDGSYLYDDDSENAIVLFCPPEPKAERSLREKMDAQKHKTQGKIFLKFNFNQQYEIGLTSNLYRPYIIIHSRYMKALGDKLLFSSSYIMDYILKFHPHGFSWRNLEMVPDIILTNKDPNLRAFMQDLMQFLSRMYIRETVNGMFQYRFFSKVVNEIRFLSKISEQGAAAFNFTLDESQQIKHYYRNKLQQQLKQHQEPVRIARGKAPFVHSISFLHNLVGDLHYYDKEYDDAIIHYSDAAQPLRERVPSGKLTNHQVVLLVRTQLKLGMALERIRAFDSAYSIYRSLMMDIPRLLQSKDGPQSDMPLSRMQLLVRPYIAILDLVEKQRIDGITISNLRKNLADLNTLLNVGRQYPILEPPKVDNEAPKTKDTRDRPRLNTLYSDYFSNVGSVLFFKNFNFPEVYDKFKQGLPIPNAKQGETPTTGFKELKEENLAAFMGKHRGQKEEALADYNPSLSAYIYYRQAISEQLESVYAALDKAGEMPRFKEYKKGGLQIAVLMLHPDLGYLTNSMQMYIMGNLFSKLGDAVLSSVGGEVRPLSKEILDIYMHDEAEGGYDKLLTKCRNAIEKEEFPFEDGLNAALLLFRISGLFYLKANRSYSSAFQFKKFLFVVKDWLAFRGRKWLDGVDGSEQSREERTGFLKELNQLLIDDTETISMVSEGTETISMASRLFRSIVWSADVANRPQILKYREILNLDRTEGTFSIYNNISTSPEMREVVLLIEEIRLKLYCLGALEEAPDLKLVTPYDTISSKYLRALELKYKCEHNYVLFNKLGGAQLLALNYFKEIEPDPALLTILKTIKDKGNDIALENCVFDSIFCLYEVIRSLNIYGMNYVTNHSFLANAHYKLANWCRAFHNLRYGYAEHSEEAINNPSSVRLLSQQYDDKLIKILGTDALYALEPNYHIEQALEHYYAAVQTHKGGRSYRENATNMSFLEDDLNDNLTHFSAAAERFRINTGVIRIKILDLKEQLKTSQVYQFDSYAGYKSI